MTIREIERENEIELLLEGHLSSVTGPQAEAILMEAAAHTQRLVLNLAALTYISSAGLRVIKKVYLSMLRSGGTLYMRSVPRTVMEVLEMTGLSGILHFL